MRWTERDCSGSYPANSRASFQGNLSTSTAWYSNNKPIVSLNSSIVGTVIVIPPKYFINFTKESFSSIKDYWYEAVLANGLEGVIFGVAGNKNDLYENEKVNKEEVRNFSNEINATFKFTSAKQNTCIDELFKELGKKYVESDFIKELGQEYFDKNSRNGSFQLDESHMKKRRKKCC